MRRTCAAVIAVAAVVLVGCGGSAASSDDGSPGVSITHAFGTTVVPEDPERIVALSFEEDALSRVGLATVGHADNAYEPGEPYPWQTGQVDLGESEPVVGANGTVNLERIAALKPDLILATNFYGLEETYAQLSEIAPTVGYRTGWGEATWQDTAAVIGTAVGRSDEMAGAVAEVEEYLAGLAAEMPGLRGKTYAGTYHHSPGGFAVNTDPDGQAARVLGELGLVPSRELNAAVVDRSLSEEKLSLLDVDLLLISFATAELQTTLEANPMYANLAVVRDGRVFVGDNFAATAGNNPTLLNIPWSMEQRRDVFERVAAG